MKQLTVRFAVFLLSALLLASCAGAPVASSTPAGGIGGNEQGDSALTILFTNDIHGRINNDSDEPSYGYARIAQIKNELQEQGDVLLFSAGDVLQGTPYVNESDGATAIELMNSAGYDAMTPGNHDFDWGADNLLALRDEATFDMLSANILYEEDDAPVFLENKIFTSESGVKVGVFGLTTPSTKTTTTPSAVEGIRFLADEELYAAAQNQVDVLEEQGCDLVVCLSHLGIDDSTMGSRSYDVIEAVSGIDLFIDAHSHVELNEMQGDTLLVSTGAFGHNLGVASYEDGVLSAELLPAVIEDEDTEAYAEEVTQEVDDSLGETVAQTEVVLDGEYETVRNSETNLGDLTTDAMLWYANTELGIEADVSVMNAGSIRASIGEGDITLEDVKTVFPYGNTLVTLNITGAQLLEALEAASAELPEPTAPFAQVSGVEYTVHTQTAYEEGEAYPDSTFYAPLQPGSRVEIHSVSGEDFSPEAVYTLVTIDFLAMGGDSYYVFTQASEGSVIDSGVLLEDAFAAYITDTLAGVVGSEYAAPQGRITVE